MPETVLPPKVVGVWDDHEPLGPDDEVRTMGPFAVAPTAAQAALEADAGLSQETPV
jgi:hypothetical protein